MWLRTSTFGRVLLVATVIGAGIVFLPSVDAQSSLPGLTSTGSLPPPTSGTYAYNTFFPAVGASYVDPVFGTTIRRLSGDRQFDDIYARNMDFNANGTRYVHGANVIDTSTGTVTHTVPRGTYTGDAGFDPIDPNVYYYNTGSTIHKVTLGSGGAKTDVVFYTASASIDALGQSVNWISGDGQLFLVNAGGSVKVIDKATMTAYSGTIPSPSGGGWLGIAPSGNHAVGYWNNNGYSWTINKTTKTVGSQNTFWSGLCGDHAVPASGSDGHDYGIVGNCNNHDEIWRVDVDSNAAGKTEDQQRAMAGNKLLKTEDWTQEHHFSSVGRGALQDWAFLSEEYANGDGFNSSPSPWSAYRQEILAINFITGEIRRLAHHRSRGISGDYGYQPRVTSAWDGSYVAWASNFNQSGGSDIYAVAFGAASGGGGGGGGSSAPIISSVTSSGVTASAATITWTTDQSADSQVNYGTTTNYGSSTTLDGTMVTSHSQSLSGLSAGTTYHYRVNSKNAGGQNTTSGDFTFTTVGPPAISSIVVANLTATSVQISWITNQTADSQVEYGTTAAYGTSTTLDTSLVTAHSVIISGLTQNTTYHYRVRSTNSSGLLGTSSDATFIATVPPVISGVGSSAITGTGATITWTTDQASDTQVDYGTTTNYGSSTTLNSAAVTSHSQNITGLSQSTTYHYRVKSRNPQGALATSTDFTFQTASPATISAVASSNIGSSTATVTWTTSAAADSQVEYGTTTSYGTSTTLDTTMVTSHSQNLSGLAPGTTYNYRVKSRNAAGVLATSANSTFTTVGPPAITSVSATSITGTTATIIWTTNQAADTQVDYGTTTNYGSSTTLNASMVTSHSQALSSLATGTLYHFRVKSRNSQNLLTTSGDFTFTTVAPPTISAVSSSSITSSSATITWTTNQNSDSQIDWGTTTSYGTTSALDTLMVTSHGRSLTGLVANTLYHYRVKSRNSAGLLTTSGDFTFTTVDTNTNDTLTVSKSGNGSGSVIGPLAGISCSGNNGSGNGSGSCSGSVKKGTTVTLTAMPAAGSEFAGWSGACTGTGTNCTVTVNASTSVTARFDVGTEGDFNGDGYPDLPMQNIDGSLALWLMQGSTRLSGSAITPMVTSSGIDWQIINPGSPDDPDAGPGGSTGFQHPIGGQLSAVYLTTDSRILDTRWQIGGTPDLDGNGRADLLWQNTATGQLAAWIMDGPVKTQGRFLSPSTIDPSWTMRGTGDFNGDGKADILFQQAGTGALLCWLMDGTTKIGEHTLLPGNVAATWTLVGTADFNNDGQTDIVWQNTQTGDVYVWYMNGTSMSSEQAVGRFGEGWSVRAVGDFDNDGHADLIWQKSTGELAAWFMNGLIQTTVTYLTPGSIDPSWTIMGPR